MPGNHRWREQELYFIYKAVKNVKSGRSITSQMKYLSSVKMLNGRTEQAIRRKFFYQYKLLKPWLDMVG